MRRLEYQPVEFFCCFVACLFVCLCPTSVSTSRTAASILAHTYEGQEIDGVVTVDNSPVTSPAFVARPDLLERDVLPDHLAGTHICVMISIGSREPFRRPDQRLLVSEESPGIR